VVIALAAAEAKASSEQWLFSRDGIGGVGKVSALVGGDDEKGHPIVRTVSAGGAIGIPSEITVRFEQRRIRMR